MAQVFYSEIDAYGFLLANVKIISLCCIIRGMKLVQSKTLTLFVLIAYLYLGVFSLLSMSGHDHMPMTDCPYMVGQQSMCAMDTFEHLTAWKSLVLTIPSFIYVLTLLVLVFSFQHLLSSSPPLLRQLLYYRKTKFEPITTSLELAFARGILNPKPY